MKRIFFIDFDGTITLEDTCNLMAARFCRSDWEETNQQWERGELGTIDCARSILGLMDATRAEIIAFLESVPIDPYFKEFWHRTQADGDELFIISDGYDLNIRTILAQNGLGSLLYFANELLLPDPQLLNCPYYNDQCGRCGTCKTDLVRLLSQPGCQTVYIGDGTSDQCPVNHVEVIFAKHGLLEYCREHNLPAREFHDFRDIIAWQTGNSDLS